MKVYAGQGRVFTDFWACRRQAKKYHGAYPGGVLDRLRENWIGDGLILHVCGGTVRDGVTIDINPEVDPTIVGDARMLPLKDGSVPNAMVDPPYDEKHAEWYGYPYPRPYTVLAEAVRVVKPGGYVGMLHWLALMRPKGTHRVAVIGITIGANMRIRCLSLFRKDAVLEDFEGR